MSDYIDLKIIEWHAIDQATEDEDDDSNSESNDGRKVDELEYVIRMFGRTETGKSITVKVCGFQPFYYIKVPKSTKNANAMIDAVSNYFYVKGRIDCVKSKLVKARDMYGFNNGKQFNFVKLVFYDHVTMLNSRYMFMNPIVIPGQPKIKYSLYESNFEPFIRFCHIQDIKMAGWVRVNNYKKTRGEARTDIEIECDWKSVIGLNDRVEKARFLQAAWDIEVYSHDRSFPKPEILQNEVFQIGVTLEYAGDHSDLRQRYIFTLKKYARIDDPGVNIHVIECKDEPDLIRKFCEFIIKKDPDIFLLFNGDGFDCNYMGVRAKRWGLKKLYLSSMSRLKDVPGKIKYEEFHSSAYGDSNYNRLYAPGRLNYDLLIHYRRNKKLVSYKLDYIAEEYLGERKHPISPKEIFIWYKEGNPERIRKIGEYCIQDCEILQKLMNKQMILESITELSNVTFVPISYLVTKGQTIKVLSQIYRKSMQMGFLVPHTNFNSDSFPVKIKSLGKGIDINHLTGTFEFEYTNPTGKSFPRKMSGIVTPRDGSNCDIVDTDDYNKDTSPTSSVLYGLVNNEVTEDKPLECKMTCNGKSYKVLVTMSDDLSQDSYTGATVLEPIPGIYLDNVMVLDFASLYPTIMISNNLCFSTFVDKDEYRNLEGVEYDLIEWEDSVAYKLNKVCQGVFASGKQKGEKCSRDASYIVYSKNYCKIHDPLKKSRLDDEKVLKRNVQYSYTIAKAIENADGTWSNKGIVPSLLEELYNDRKRIKKLMNKAFNEGNTELGNIYNSQQMAVKISLNSTYGFMGRKSGNLAKKELGSIVTSIGRGLIEFSKAYTEGEFSDFLRESQKVQHQIRLVDISAYDLAAKNAVLLEACV